LLSPSNGPATTWRTATPGYISTQRGCLLDVARVKISTEMPASAIRLAVSTM